MLRAARHPSPRSNAALATMMSGSSLLLHGGGDCRPGCTVLGDTWILRIADAVALSQRGSAVPHADILEPYATSGSLSSLDVCAEWEEYRVRPATAFVARGTTTFARLAPSLFTDFRKSSSGVHRIDLDQYPPPKRYRHTLTSASRAWQESVKETIRRLSDASFAGLSFYETSGRVLYSPPLLFGGESFDPAAYFNDLYAWVDVEMLQSAGIVVHIRWRTQLYESACAFTGICGSLRSGVTAAVFSQEFIVFYLFPLTTSLVMACAVLAFYWGGSGHGSKHSRGNAEGHRD